MDMDMILAQIRGDKTSADFADVAETMRFGREDGQCGLPHPHPRLRRLMCKISCLRPEGPAFIDTSVRTWLLTAFRHQSTAGATRSVDLNELSVVALEL